jgi:hypothetical protein
VRASCISSDSRCRSLLKTNYTLGLCLQITSNKVLVTSGAQRASQTLQLLGEQQAKKKGMLSGLFCTNADAMAMQVSMELLPSLHPAGIAPRCEELFDKNGYAPLGPCPPIWIWSLTAC